MKKKVDMLESEPDDIPTYNSESSDDSKNDQGFITPDKVEEYFTVDVVSRVRYSFPAANRKAAIALVKSGEFPKTHMEVLKESPQTNTVITIGYRMKD